jgi:regulator of sigma E protease
LLSLLISMIGIVLTILLIVGIHEFGHFFAAKCLGVKVLRFSIGFGKALWRKSDKTGTEYVFAAIPLGGYVKMLDESEGDVAPLQRRFAFNQQPFYKKFIIVAAGPFANLILAFILYWLLFVIGFVSMVPVIGKIMPGSIAFHAGLKPQQEIVAIDNHATNSWMKVIINMLAHTGDSDRLQIDTKAFGSAGTPQKHILDLTDWHMDNLKPDPLDSLGIQPYEPTIPAIIDKILPDSPAAHAGIQTGDKIISVDGKTIVDWITLITIIDKNPDKKLVFQVSRQGKLQTITVITRSQRDMYFNKHGYLGITPQFQLPKGMLRKVQYNPLAAIEPALQNVYDFTYMNFLVMGKLLLGKASLQSLGGPISIFQTAGLAINQGIAPFISFLAFISISIGLINVFPLPGLDGGHLLFQIIEAIIRRPIPPRVLALCYRLGIILLVLLIFQAVINDVLRLQ